MSAVGAERQPIYDGWRGIAVLCVLIGHFFFDWGINLGHFGIEMFLVLSGALMAKLLFEDRQPLADFAVRRISRIYPMLVVVIFAIALLSALLPDYPRVTALQVISGLTLTFNQVFAQHHLQAGPLRAIWSVTMEAHCYLILGFVALAHRRWNIPVLPTLLILAGTMMTYGVIRAIDIPHYTHAYWRTEIRGASVLAGAAAYLIVSGRKEWLGGWANAALPLFALSVLLQTYLVPDPIKYTAGTSLAALSLALLAQQRDGALTRIAGSPPLVFFGTISYSLYLWQIPFWYLSDNAVLMVSLSVGLSCVTYWLVEKPARRAIIAWFGHRGRASATVRSPG